MNTSKVLEIINGSNPLLSSNGKAYTITANTNYTDKTSFWTYNLTKIQIEYLKLLLSAHLATDETIAIAECYMSQDELKRLSSMFELEISNDSNKRKKP